MFGFVAEAIAVAEWFELVVPVATTVEFVAFAAVAFFIPEVAVADESVVAVAVDGDAEVLLEEPAEAVCVETDDV